jgi:hypothetical protein
MPRTLGSIHVDPFLQRMGAPAAPARADLDGWNSQGHRDVGVGGERYMGRLEAMRFDSGRGVTDDIGVERCAPGWTIPASVCPTVTRPWVIERAWFSPSAACSIMSRKLASGRASS